MESRRPTPDKRRCGKPSVKPTLLVPVCLGWHSNAWSGGFQPPWPPGSARHTGGWKPPLRLSETHSRSIAEDAPEENASPSAAAVRRRQAETEPLEDEAHGNRARSQTVVDQSIELAAEGCRTAPGGLCCTRGRGTADGAPRRAHRLTATSSLFARLICRRNRFWQNGLRANRRN